MRVFARCVAKRTSVFDEDWTSDLVTVVLETVRRVDVLGFIVAFAERADCDPAGLDALLLTTLQKVVDVNLLATLGQRIFDVGGR